MADDRLARILARLDVAGGAATTRLCVVCAEVTGLSGAGIMLMSDDLPQGSVCTTDTISAIVEELQYTLGQGPCVDAHRQQHPIVEPDLADPATVRWAAFAPPAVDAGVRAVFGFPVAIGAVRLGALNLYRDRPGPLAAERHADAVLLASVAARSIIGMQADAPPGALGTNLETGTDFQYVVHQAAGMVAVQLGVGLTEALIRLRANAFSHERLVADVARDVVARRLRFDGAGGTGTETR